ncbi:MAG: low molecular weight phosphotyrosine protein phosphatase [Candidatus Thioglobus sp.]|nr:low molecular weight phosphotyrosine protein phosphatase [Candidatus Thioglobus sp.]
MGNICRSPTAEGLLKYQVKKRGVEDLFEIDSAGTHAYHTGEPPDSRAQIAAKKQGIDLSQQRARQVDEADFYHFDFILAMDSSNLADLHEICPKNMQHKLSLILDNVPNNIANNQGQSVPDPYFNGGFDNIVDIVNNAVKHFLRDKI